MNDDSGFLLISHRKLGTANHCFAEGAPLSALDGGSWVAPAAFHRAARTKMFIWQRYALVLLPLAIGLTVLLRADLIVAQL